ncbi:MAG TPA: response regulator transcription factor [Kiloniellaceae bacterium]|nr:response regulator transcription factor [Kiloniellaceae bacterium]
MNILIVDDECLARERLAQMVEELGGDHRVAGQAANGEEAVAACREGEVDLVLMDIRMPGMDGMEAAARLAEMETPPAVVFVTAYDEHALEAFERRAVDYLLKPVRKARLEKALARAVTPTRAHLQKINGAAPPDRRTHISAPTPGGIQSVAVEEVLCFRADSKYVAVCHAEGELLVEESLKALEQEFGDLFIRIHRGILAARRHVEGMEKAEEGWRLRLHGMDEGLPISRRHLPAVRRWLREGRFSR